MSSQSQENHLRIVHRNVAPEIEEFAISSAKYKLENYLKGEKDYPYFKSIAKEMKYDLEKKFEGTWHVVVGKSFGSFITCEQNRYEIYTFSHTKPLTQNLNLSYYENKKNKTSFHQY